MKRWLLTLAAMALLGLAALTVDRWLEPLLTFVGANANVIQGLASLVQLILWVGAAGVAVFSYWRGRRQPPAARPPQIKTQGGAAARDVETQGGDFIGRDQIIVVQSARDIAHWLRTKGTQLSEATLQKVTEEYLQGLLDRHRYLSLKGLGINERVPLKLPLLDLYIPLQARLEMPEGETWKREVFLAGRAAGSSAEEPGLHLSEPQPALDLLRHNDGLIILGDPGAGKTTFLKFLALRLAFSQPEHDLGLGQRLPILLPLSAYANALSQKDLRLDEFIAEYVYTAGSDLPIAQMLNDALQAGVALILLDGLDEVKDLALRNTVVEQVVNFYVHQRRVGNKFVLTSRIVGYAAVRPTAEGLAECTLTDLNDEEIERFVERWTAALEKQAQGETASAQVDAERERQELLEAIKQNQGVRQLAANPLLLTILALMKRQDVKLPERRVELYDHYVTTLLSTWNRARSLGTREPGREVVGLRAPRREVDPVKTLRVLAPLALWMHQNDQRGLGLVRREALRRELETIYRARNEAEPERVSQQFMEDVREYAGLLLERGHDEYGFIHLTFQEFLAAVGIALKHQGDAKSIVATLSQYVDHPAWREVILLTVGYVGIRQQLETVAGQIVEGLAQAPSEKLGQSVVLAGQAVIDAMPEGVPHTTQEHLLPQLITTMQAVTVTPEVRRQAGLALGRLGWKPDDLECFVPVRAGKFLYGDGKQEREITYDYWMAKYPVTNAQYRCFMKDKGYQRKEFWSDAGWKWKESNGREAPPRLGDLEFGNALVPVVSVTWYEAEAYCRWLNHTLTAIQIGPEQVLNKPAHYEVRLPLEEEWEYAARGNDGREYPWGDDFKADCANTEESDPKGHGIGTTCVCTYPQGISPTQVWDMSGNVWEWTNSLEGKSQVLRGGSWILVRRYARCAYRLRDGADDFDFSFGFRPVVSLASSSGF